MVRVFAINLSLFLALIKDINRFEAVQIQYTWIGEWLFWGLAESSSLDDWLRKVFKIVWALTWLATTKERIFEFHLFLNWIDWNNILTWFYQIKFDFWEFLYGIVDNWRNNNYLWILTVRSCVFKCFQYRTAKYRFIDGFIAWFTIQIHLDGLCNRNILLTLFV